MASVNTGAQHFIINKIQLNSRSRESSVLRGHYQYNSLFHTMIFPTHANHHHRVIICSSCPRRQPQRATVETRGGPRLRHALICAVVPSASQSFQRTTRGQRTGQLAQVQLEPQLQEPEEEQPQSPMMSVVGVVRVEVLRELIVFDGFEVDLVDEAMTGTLMLREQVGFKYPRLI